MAQVQEDMGMSALSPTEVMAKKAANHVARIEEIVRRINDYLIKNDPHRRGGYWDVSQFVSNDLMGDIERHFRMAGWDVESNTQIGMFRLIPKSKDPYR